MYNKNDIKTQYTDSVEFIENLINDTPGSKNSIVLSFLNEINLRDIFEFLMEIFTKLCLKKFGSNGKVNLTQLTTNDFLMLAEYFNSFGYQINYELLDRNKDYVRITYLTNNHHYKNITTRPNLQLKDFYYILALNGTYNVYAIHFDILPMD